MQNILVDTNIILDLLARRSPFYNEAAELFTLADNNKISLAISSLSLANTHYVLAKYKRGQEAKKILRRFRVLVKVLAFDDRIADLALNSGFKDFEDAIQYYTAIENDQQLIVSRNLSGFRKSRITVLTAREFLKTRDVD
jgi:predicted nucleic acid-binding protein